MTFSFEFDLFGEGKKDTSKQGQIKQWVREVYGLADDIPVIVAEIRCDIPGCAPVETIIAILEPGGRRQFKSPRPMKEVDKHDVKNLLPNPEGHGPRIDIDRLDGSIESPWS